MWMGTLPARKPLMRSFFDSFFQQNENVYCQLTVTNISILGTVATLNVDFGLSALYIMDLPPMTYQSEGSDLMVFVLEDDRWNLTSWQADSGAEDVDAGCKTDIDG